MAKPWTRGEAWDESGALERIGLRWEHKQVQRVGKFDQAEAARGRWHWWEMGTQGPEGQVLSLIHISEPTRLS